MGKIVRFRNQSRISQLVKRRGSAMRAVDGEVSTGGS